MLEKFNQDVKDNSKALQAGGNITIVGMQYGEVKDLFLTLFENNFPKLKEIAQNTAIENVQKFISEFEKNITKDQRDIDIDKFTDPNIQYSLNEAIQTSARRGNTIDLGILSSLIIEQIKIESNDLLQIVCNEAITIIPKLTKKQIDFLSYHFYVRFKADKSIKEISEIEKKVYPVWDTFNNGICISNSNIEHLLSIGALTNISGIRAGTYSFVLDNYDFLKLQFNKESKYDNESDLEQKMEEISPTLKKILDLFESTRACNYRLTTAGKLIALINLKRIFPDIEYKEWIY